MVKYRILKIFFKLSELALRIAQIFGHYIFSLFQPYIYSVLFCNQFRPTYN